MSREKILAKVASLHSTVVAFQALWDGDSSGWFVRLYAVTSDGKSHPLGGLSDGGDIRLFNGLAPPWSEAIAARQLGNELAERYGVEFYFPSPDHPEDDCPDWKDRDKGYPCRRCGILLLQGHDCRWRGTCYFCHLDEEREQREAKWSVEQRAGARCQICGNPAANELNGGPACADCFGKYEVYRCEKCDGVTTVLESIGHTSLCSWCEIQNVADSLTAAQRNAIRDAMAKGRFEGLKTAIDVMGGSLRKAQDVLEVLGASDTREDPT